MLRTKGTDISFKRKLYGLIVCRLEGEKLPIWAYRERISELVEKGIGGFIIFGGERSGVKQMIEEVQAIAENPLFIASDIERGVGQQIRGYTSFPCQMALSAGIDKNTPEDVDVLRSALRAVADEAKDVGINMPLVPVLDVNRDPDNPIICTRAFSDDPEVVMWFGSEYIDVLESSGLLSCAKHFPGHGDTAVDSHMTLPVIRKSVDALMETDVAPFIKAVRRGVSCVMAGHLSIPAVDDKPACLSKKIITDILRKGLGFEGLIMTDALNMDALKEVASVPAQCIQAGVDILLHPVDPDLTVKELISAVESEMISIEMIEAASERILGFKAKLSKQGDRIDLECRAHKLLSSQISEKSISLIKNTPGILPLRDIGETTLISAGDEELYNSSPWKNYFNKSLRLQDAPEKISSPVFHSEIAGTAGDNTTAVIAVFTNVAAWKGSSGISDYDRGRIHDVIGRSKHSIVVSFGSPYVLRYFGRADILIAAYEATEQAQRAVIKCLEGSLDFKGRLPVKIVFL